MRNQLTIQVNALTVDLDNANARLDEEGEAATTLRGQLSRSQADLTALRSKFDKEIQARIEECDDLK